MLSTKRFSRANKGWEDRTEPDKNWTHWKQAYKKSHTKARIQAQINEGTVKFGAANSDAHQENTQNVENKKAVNKRGIKALGGYFSNLAAVNEK